MEQVEAVSLIKNGIAGNSVQRWADLGCGGGTFTRALADLLPAASHIVAVDKERQRLPGDIHNVSVEFIRSDFINDSIVLVDVDGILMSNSLHYVKDKIGLLKKLEVCFGNERRFIIVEYDSRRANPWVPYPIPYLQLADIAAQLGYHIQKMNELPSRFGGVIYSALLWG
jgi:ubiquinone/menaquinone biosynthesis C-methylase UbiE